MKTLLKVGILFLIPTGAFATSVNTPMVHTTDEVHNCGDCVGRNMEFARQLQPRNEQHEMVVRSHRFARFLNKKHDE